MVNTPYILKHAFFPNIPQIKNRFTHLIAIILICIVLSAAYYSLIFPFETTVPWLGTLGYYEYKAHLVGSLFIIPLIYSAIIFNWQITLVIWCLSLVIMLPRIIYLSINTIGLISNIAYACIPFMIIILISLQVERVKHQKQAAIERENERQHFTSEILKSQENERYRLSRELHDDIVQTLIAITSKAENILHDGYDINSSAIESQIKWIKQTSENLQEEIRRIMLDLRPAVLDNLGLIPAVRWMVNNIQDIEADFSVEGEIHSIEKDIEVSIFRIIQELLNNVKSHSGATNVNVSLIYGKNYLEIVVQDNGSGFPIPKSLASFTLSEKLGLAGIQERIKLHNGILNIISNYRNGTIVTVKLDC